MNLRKASILIILILLLGITNSCTKKEDLKEKEKSTKLTWLSYDKGFSLAEKREKYVLMFFDANWCYWCRVINRQMRENKKINDYLRKKFVLIRVDVDKEQDLIAKYRISGVPTLWFLKPDKELIAPIPGYVEPEALYKTLVYINEGHYKEMSFTEFEKKL